MKKIILLFVSFFSGISVFSQQKVVADKIVGIVGDKIVLKSDITSAISDIVRQGGQAPEDCSILDGMMIQKALVLQAERDSIPVSDDDVEAEIDQKVRYFINMYGSKEALEQIAGRTIYQLKEDFRQPIREQRMAQGMRNKVVQDVKITPTEVKAYYDRIPKDSLRFYESELQIGELVIFPKASHDIEKLAIDELSDYKRQVEAGLKKFDALAKLYSDDPGSKDKGGEYQLSRSDKQWDPVFLAAAFRLKDGQISPVIKTQFGYHIIQMVSRNGDDAIIRHILRVPQITDVEINEATNRLDSIRSQLIKGTIGFGEAVVKYSDDPNAKFTAGLKMARDGSTYLTIDQLDKEIVKLLKDLKVGEYSQPISFTDERGKKGVHIIELISKSDPHRENLKDDYNKIAQRALEEKKQDALEKWFKSKLPSYYIMIDNDYKSCPNLGKWEISATASK
ncbi:MAG TPA: peptidylprolyl isomerase [Puia sp.]|nr:peptidylprolyl isomerase [Puia sp.]